MPTFSYRALQSDGTMAEGQLDAPGRPDALRQVETLGLRPVSLAEKAATAVAKNGSPLPASFGNLSLKFESKKVSGKDLENFTRLLSSLLAAGVPLSRALVILYKEASSPAAQAKWKEVHDLVIDGMSLANAMAKSPETFPRVYTAMVEAGEAGGFLDVVLAQIADFQAREKDLRSKVMTAMVYPCILLVLALVVLTVLLVFFIPKFQKIFSSVHGAPAFDHTTHHRRQSRRPFLRIVCRDGPGGRRLPRARPGSPPKRGAGSGKTWFCNRPSSAR